MCSFFLSQLTRNSLRLECGPPFLSIPIFLVCRGRFQKTSNGQYGSSYRSKAERTQSKFVSYSLSSLPFDFSNEFLIFKSMNAILILKVCIAQLNPFVSL